MRPRREALCPLFVLHCRTMQRDVGDQKGSRSVDNDRVGLRELGQNVSRVLNRVKQRETLVVTEHGQPIAHLAPYQAENELEAMTARGEVTAATSAALGGSSAYTWLKIPFVPDMARVMESTTLPTLILGGDNQSDPEALYSDWAHALTLPGVRGLVVGRSLLYPASGTAADAISRAVDIVHG